MVNTAKSSNEKKSYEDLDIYNIAVDLAVEVHRMTLQELPKFEMYEEGDQIRRSSKSIGANIVEGFGRKRHKGEYAQFLTYALASCDETKYHLTMLYKTSSLDKAMCDNFLTRYAQLGRKIYNFRKVVLEH